MIYSIIYSIIYLPYNMDWSIFNDDITGRITVTKAPSHLPPPRTLLSSSSERAFHATHGTPELAAQLRGAHLAMELYQRKIDVFTNKNGGFIAKMVVLQQKWWFNQQKWWSYSKNGGLTSRNGGLTSRNGGFTSKNVSLTGKNYGLTAKM